MRNFKSRQLKSAFVLLFAMLIFSISCPCVGVTAYAEEDQDIRVVFEDDDEIEDDDDDDEDDEDDGEDEDDADDEDDGDGADTKDDNAGQGKQPEPSNNSNTTNNSKKSSKKTSRMTHRKVTVEASSKATTYYDKVVPGDDIRITVKIRGHKVKSKKLKFSSSKKSVASVSKDGVITANKKGTAKIKIRSKTNKKDKCTMIVTVADSSVRTLFIGDSRSVDIFSGSESSILGEVHDDIVVCAMNSAKIFFMKDVLKNSDLSDYDTIITWMGANDYGAFNPYKKNYSKLVSSGKKLVLCTVGASGDQYMPPQDLPYFGNGVINSFNSQLKKWAKKKKVDTIPLFEYVQKNVHVDSKDGVHYSPKPNKNIWNYILDNIS